MPAPKIKNKVVSKRDYLRYLGRKGWLGISALLIELLSIVVTGGLFGFFVYQLTEDADDARKAVLVPVLCFIAILLWYPIQQWMTKNASLLFKEAKAMEPVEPMTRHNTGQLPQEETLVRASEEPKEAQEKILLRAAQHTDETRSEELLRPF